MRPIKHSFFVVGEKRDEGESGAAGRRFYNWGAVAPVPPAGGRRGTERRDKNFYFLERKNELAHW